MKKNKKNKVTGLEAFEEYYSFLYGERWPLLKEALKKENLYVKFLHEGNALSLNSENDFSPCQPYFLDPASLVSGLCLPLDNATSVLDLCAAPGGKSLVVASCLQENASLTSNERSPERKNRLSKVVSSCLPFALSQKVKVTCSDGALWCKKENLSFDSILLDAPCSSERHVLKSEKYLKDWTPNRVKTMHMEQWALLSSAFRILKDGGYLLYSTCALSKEENDGIIGRLLKKFDNARLLPYQAIKSTFEKNLSKVQNIVFTAQATSSIDDDFSLEEGAPASLNEQVYSKETYLPSKDDTAASLNALQSSKGASLLSPNKSPAFPDSAPASLNEQVYSKETYLPSKDDSAASLNALQSSKGASVPFPNKSPAFPDGAPASLNALQSSKGASLLSKDESATSLNTQVYSQGESFLSKDDSAASLNALQSSKGASLLSPNKSPAPPATSSAIPLILSTFQNAQATEFGYHILPDAAFACGPIYFSLIKKENSSQY